MAEVKVNVDNREESVNSLTFDEKVIKKIAGIAASEIPGILAMSGNFLTGVADMLKAADDPTKGITVEVGKKQVAVDMNIVCEYGRHLPEVFDSIVESVSNSIREMTGLEVVELNVHVADILLKEDFERKKRAAEKVVRDAAEEEALPVEVYEEAAPSRVE